MSLTYRILFHIAKTKNQSKFFWGGGRGRHGSAWRSWTEAMEGRLSTEPQGKLKL